MTMTELALRPRARAAAFLLALATATMLGCGDDPFAPKADTEVVNAAIEVWALTGAPTNFPTVIFVPQRFAARPDAGASFDLGFDIDANGDVQVLPVSRVMTALTAPRRVGFAQPSPSYAAITEAPRGGWVYDSILTVGVGEPFVVRVQTQYCNLQIQTEVYAKYVVDSVFPAERRIRLSGRVNPNCGFRSFGDGVPTF